MKLANIVLSVLEGALLKRLNTNFKKSYQKVLICFAVWGPEGTSTAFKTVSYQNCGVQMHLN